MELVASNVSHFPEINQNATHKGKEEYIPGGDRSEEKAAKGRHLQHVSSASFKRGSPFSIALEIEAKVEEHSRFQNISENFPRYRKPRGRC
jgi:hypothetical protein